MPTHLCAVKRAWRDQQELAAISGVAIAESDDPLTINLYYNPSLDSRARADTGVRAAFHFRINIPPKYPFHPPLFKWISRPAGPAGHTPFLGPNGDVSISALSHWTPASSLSNVLISLFPSALLAAQCCSVTSHIWLMGEGRGMTSTAFTDPQVLHCLAEYLLHHEPASAHALHQTCRAAASAVQQAVSALSVVAQHVDIVHSVHTFSGLSQLKCTQCSLTCQSVFQVDVTLRLMSSLRSLSIVRCSVDALLGGTGIFAALKSLPNLDEFAFEPATSMLWALYDNRGMIEHAANPFGEDAVLTLPPEVPKPVPDEWASIWVGLASVTQLKTLKITAPLCDLAPREATRHSWSAAARIVNYAFSDTCLSSMPCLQNLTIDLQHVNMRSARPVGEALQPPDSRASASDDFCAWDLPSRPLKSLSLSGVALGDRQLNYKQTTKDFWGSLEHLEIGHTAVSDDLQATALKMLVYLVQDVRSLNVASLEELLSKLASNPMCPVSYVTLSKLEHLSTTLVGKLADVQQLTRLELRSCKSYVNLSLVVDNLPQLRILEGLPFKPGTDHRFYWPLRQCSKLEKLVTLPGPPGAALSIRSMLGPGVHVHVPVWPEDSPESQAVFRRGFYPAHRPMLSSYDPSNSSDTIAVSPGSPSNDAGVSTYQGYALGRVRSQSPAPSQIADSPSRHDGGSRARAVGSNVPAHASEQRVHGASGSAQEAAIASLAASVVAPPNLPRTPAPDGAVQLGSRGARVSASAGQAAGALSENAPAGSTSHTMGAPVSTGFITDMADWGGGLTRLLTAQFATSTGSEGVQGGASRPPHLSCSAGHAAGLSRHTSQSSLQGRANRKFTGSGFANALDPWHAGTESCPETGGALSGHCPEPVHGVSVVDNIFNEGVTQPQDSSSDDSLLSNDIHGMQDIDQPCGSRSSRAAAASHPGQLPPSSKGTWISASAVASMTLLVNVDAALQNSHSDRARERHPYAPATGGGTSRPHPVLAQHSALMTGTLQGTAKDSEPHGRTSSEGGERTHKRHAGRNVLGTQHELPGDRQLIFDHQLGAWPALKCCGDDVDCWVPRETTSLRRTEQGSQISPRGLPDGMGRRDANVTKATHIEHVPGDSTDLVRQDRREAQARPSHSVPNPQGATAGKSHAPAPGMCQPHGSLQDTRLDFNPLQHELWPFVGSPADHKNHNAGVDGAENSLKSQRCTGRAATMAPLQAEDGSDSDSGQLSTERRRLSSLAIRRSVHTNARRRAAARETYRQTLGDGAQVARSLLMCGAESTPHGVSATPRNTKTQTCLSVFHTAGAAACNLYNANTASICVEGKGAARAARALHILELPLCPQGHRLTLIAQINAQASPQFEQLGPYLFRVGCCKICRLQIPSLLDLSVDDVSGTCTDTILVVSPELSQAVTCSTMQAGKRPRAAMQDSSVPHGSEQFTVKQVHKYGPQKEQLQVMHSQLSYLAWISCWAPTEPALESPTRNDVQALARAYTTVPPPISEHAHERAAARLGGTRATASPACRLCCNRMRLVVTLPCNGSVVCEAQRCSDILQTFKCHLHPQEMQCSWTSVAAESGRSSAEA